MPNACNPRIYLASRSPRRRELLHQIGVAFDTIAYPTASHERDEVDETPLSGEDAADYVRRLARSKAEHGWNTVRLRRLLPQPVLAADTALELDGAIIGKPRDLDDAHRILRRLSGRAHRVLTAVAMSFEGRTEDVISISEVRFGVLHDADIRRYVLSGEPLDKAGAYGIQGRAGMFVQALSGSYSGVMGLPLYETAHLLRKFGYPL